jgi:hypothetical protein
MQFFHTRHFRLSVAQRFAYLAFCVALAGFAAPVRAASPSYDFQTLDFPGASGTYVNGISGGNIVGYYFDADFKTHGFLYDGATYTTLDDPDAAPGTTAATGVSGGNIVGYYADGNGISHGFLYDGATYTTFDEPNAVASSGGTQASGISGGNIVGYYADGNGTQHGFLYNGTAYTTLDDPKATPTNGGTQASGVSGGNVAGSYYGAQATVNGFLFNGKTYAALKDAAADADTSPLGISGGNVVGFYVDADGIGHGFFYNGKTYAAVDHPDANGDTSANGIDGGNIVGWYVGTDGVVHGFLATPPGSGGGSGGSGVAPAFTTSPASLLVLAGQSASFTVSATGTPTPTYQWQFKGKPIKGATSATYTIAKVAAANAGNYTVVLSNGIGDPVTSTAATLTLGVLPKITASPASLTANLTQSVTFKVAATGTPAPSIQWQSAPAGSATFSNITSGNFSGFTGTNLTVSNITGNLSGTQFRAVATNTVGNTTSTATSKAATLSVNLPAVIAGFSAIGANTTLNSLIGGNLTVSTGASVTFSANATGTALKYQWQLNGVNIRGATRATYTIAKTALASSGNYTVSVTNAYTTTPATAGPFTLTVLTPPTIVTPLKATSAKIGAGTTLKVVASGNPIPSFTWSFAGGGLPTGSNLTTSTNNNTATSMMGFKSASASDTGIYKVVITNGQGIPATSSAKLTVK